MLDASIASVLSSEGMDLLFLIDNSPTDFLREKYLDSRISYIHCPENKGFGSGHNIAFKMAINKGYQYHFVINPDVYFDNKLMKSMVDYMAAKDKVGMLMPQILNTDSSIQYLPKMLPTPMSIVMRKLRYPNFIYRRFIDKYEMRNVAPDKICNVPILSGCFTLFRIEAVKKVGLYDDRFFMYFEDWDLSRRMHMHYETIYNPNFSVYHAYESGANKSFHLFKIFVKSAFTYFNKYGWVFDRERKKINKRAQIKS